MIYDIVYNINCSTSDCNSSAVVDLLFSQMTGSALNNCSQRQNNPFLVICQNSPWEWKKMWSRESISSNYRQIWHSDYPMSLLASSIVGGVKEQNSIVDKCLCRWWTAKRAIIAGHLHIPLIRHSSSFILLGKLTIPMNGWRNNVGSPKTTAAPSKEYMRNLFSCSDMNLTAS